MHLNRRGRRARARGLRSTPNTGRRAARHKDTALASVHPAWCRLLRPDEPPGQVERTGEEPRWQKGGAWAGKQKAPRWGEHAIDHGPGAVWAEGLGRQKD